MEEASSAAANGGLAAALADSLEPSGEASPGKAVVDVVASGEHAVTAVVGDDELTILSLGSDPETQAVTPVVPPVVGHEGVDAGATRATGGSRGDRDDSGDDDIDIVDVPATLEALLAVAEAENLSLDEASGDDGLLLVTAGEVTVEAAVETTLSRPSAADEGNDDEGAGPAGAGEAVVMATATGEEDWTGGWLGNGYCRPGVFGIEIDSLLVVGVVGLRALVVVVSADAAFTPTVTAAEKGDLAAAEDAAAAADSDGADGVDGDDSGDGKRLEMPTLDTEPWLDGEMGPLDPRGESPSPVILSALVTGTNSLGSYLSFTFSSRFESSSKTDRLPRTRLTIPDGFIPARSRSRQGCLDRSRSVTELSTLDRASPPDAQMALDPVHCSYILSSALTRSSREWSAVGECLGELRAVSESDEEGEGADGGRGGGEAGGGAGLGLGLGGGSETGLGDVTAGGDDMDDSLAADCREGNWICAANLGRGNDSGPSFSLSLGALLGSLGMMFSGLSSNNGVPGLELSPDSFPLRTVTSIELW